MAIKSSMKPLKVVNSDQKIVIADTAQKHRKRGGDILLKL